MKGILEEAIHSPSSLVANVKYRWDRAQYRAQGTYEDEHDLLLFFREREIQLRKALAASSWLEMRGLPPLQRYERLRGYLSCCFTS